MSRVRPHRGKDPEKAPYLEVWGDTVVGKSLGISVLIGSVMGAAALLGATALFERVVADPALANAYSLLVGIVACLLAGVVCGSFIKPSRIVELAAPDPAAIDEVIEVMREQRHGLGVLADIPEAARAELKELGLYEHFAAAEAKDQAEEDAQK
ncbi:hypothetical protein [Tomitella biformata]|uniref:hypothetical protein n=1 Tax=Tomitella biformata TaxID=630403 RepID=UPI000466D199|nr:hypothetical protein [Tomitella biformata]